MPAALADDERAQSRNPPNVRGSESTGADGSLAGGIRGERSHSLKSQKSQMIEACAEDLKDKFSKQVQHMRPGDEVRW